jgi:hypothetical protein
MAHCSQNIQFRKSLKGSGVLINFLTTHSSTHYTSCLRSSKYLTSHFTYTFQDLCHPRTNFLEVFSARSSHCFECLQKIQNESLSRFYFWKHDRRCQITGVWWMFQQCFGQKLLYWLFCVKRCITMMQNLLVSSKIKFPLSHVTVLEVQIHNGHKEFQW